ncbi:hypothetical protein MBLNU230_g1654t1 [Neophaeotheca triangularis]
MDGLLIDSEDLYTICTNAVLHKYGKPDLPWNIKAQMQGRPGPEAGNILFNWAQLPIPRDQYQAEIAALQKQHFPSTQTLPGVPTLLQTLAHHTSPPIHLALATSSHAANFRLKTAHLEPDFAVFAPEQRVLGDDKRIGKGRGKPAPDIYLVALETVNARVRAEGGREVRPEECLVFEDSVPGVESGRRAGMQVLWCPHVGLLGEYRGREELVLAGLMGELGEEGEGRNEELGVVRGDGSGRVKGPPGEVGDGWGRLVRSLERFPYHEYGILVEEGEGKL